MLEPNPKQSWSYGYERLTNMIASRSAVVAVMAVFSLCGVRSLAAEEWPSRPVTMVIPFAAGGPLDAIGRILAPRLSEVLGQQVVVENITGAGGMTGSNRVAKSTDNHVFLLGH